MLLVRHGVRRIARLEIPESDGSLFPRANLRSVGTPFAPRWGSVNVNPTLAYDSRRSPTNIHCACLAIGSGSSARRIATSREPPRKPSNGAEYTQRIPPGNLSYPSILALHRKESTSLLYISTKATLREEKNLHPPESLGGRKYTAQYRRRRDSFPDERGAYGRVSHANHTNNEPLVLQQVQKIAAIGLRSTILRLQSSPQNARTWLAGHP